MQYELEHAVAVLERTPRTLRALLSDLPTVWVQATEGPDTWSPFDVVEHLIHGERTDWIPRARIILQHGEAQVFEPFDRFAQFDASKGRSLDELLEEFASLRAGNLRTLREWRLTPSDLDRTGRHPEFGSVTLRQHLSTWVAHDLGHIGQVVRVMAKQYADEVGPWKAYLRVLRA